MKIRGPVAFVVVAFMIGATISQGSYAFADDTATNPFRALWDAITELQTRTDSLQAQIDEIKERGVAVSTGEQVEVSTADTSLELDVGSDDFQTLINVVAANSGDDSAVGVKILTYYQMSILDVTFIDGAQCTDQARGIIECYVGTIEPDGEARITIYAMPSQLDEQAIVTADVSSITKDADPANNHAELVFITSEEPVLVEEEEQEEQPSEEAPSEEQPSEESSEETSSEEQTGEEQPAESEQGEESSEESGYGEGSPVDGGEEGSEEQSSGEEGSESGGEESSDQGGESSSDQGSESGGSEEGGSDSSSSDSGSDSGDSSAGDSGSDSGDSGSGSDSGDSGSDSGSGDSGDSGSDGGSDSGGSDSGGDSGGESGGSDGGSGGDGGSSGGDSGGESG